MEKLYKSFLWLMLIFWCGVALAYTPQVMYTIDGIHWYPDPMSPCSAYVATKNTATITYTNIVATGSLCSADGKFVSNGGNAGPLSVGISSYLRCSDGSVPTNGECSVPPAKPPCDVPAGGDVGWNQKTGHSASSSAEHGDGAPGPYPSTSPTCGLSGPPTVTDCWSTAASGGGQDFFCHFTGKSNGQNAPSSAPSDAGAKPSSGTTPATGETSSDSQGNCPLGTSQGGVDSGGTPICVGAGTNPTGSNGGAPTDARPTGSTTTKTTDGSGTTTTTTTDTRNNGDGSTTTTKRTTTTTADGNSSTTTTTATGLTPGGKQGQADKPDNDFCRQHPDLNVCRNSTVAGRCAQISCTGDAIQCATLQQAAAMRCAKEDDDKALKALDIYTLGQSVTTGPDPEKDSLPSRANGTQVTVPSTLDTSGWLGGGQCFQDRSITVQGQVITIPLSRTCNGLLALRYALMVAASLIAFKTLRSAFLSE